MARSSSNFPEGMQFRRPRRPEEAVPRIGSKTDDAGKSSLQITRLHGTHNGGKASTKRAHYGAIRRARIERRDQKDRGTSKRRGYCLCERRRSACYVGCVRRIGLHRESTLRRSGCLGTAVGLLQVPDQLIAHRAQDFISEVDLAATRTFPSCDDAPNVSTVANELFFAGEDTPHTSILIA
jgi:hypothetical protein